MWHRWSDKTMLEGCDQVLHNHLRDMFLLSEAPLFARQLSNQLPELVERQLPVVVLILQAHELLHGLEVTGVLSEGEETDH